MIEEEFFKTFGIDKRCKDTQIIACSGKNSGCRKCDIFGYPEITAEKLLELICIVSNFYMDYEMPIHLKNVKELKETILKSLICIENNEKTKNVYIQVRKLFEES